MKRKVRFIHCADLHLDSPFKGYYNLPSSHFEEVKDSTFQALANIVEHAITNEVDFVLMAGDIFDQDGRSLKAQIRFKRELERLDQRNIDVYIIHGNHDYLDASYYPVQYPGNVFIFSSEEVQSVPVYKKGEKVANIHGFSYERRSVLQPKHAEYNKIQDDTYQIGMLHGSLATNTVHDTYAPFTVDELLKREMDYWALGHIHKREMLHQDPPIVYPGNIQARHRNEGGAKGCYLVELSQHNASLTFLETDVIRFRSVQLALEEGTLQDLEEQVNHVKQECKSTSTKTLLQLELSGSLPFHDKEQVNMLEELQEIWNEQEEGEPWVHITNMKAHVIPAWNRNKLREGSHFVAEVLRQLDNRSGIQEDIHDLLYHKQIRKYLSPFSKEEQEEIIQLAEQVLLPHLLKEE
ncbi:exonuclease SbcCD subunit D [Pontibacillus salicampi]|uniref:Exonuclease SbcCD subunit D n=1 Tax=Pontibacillus salicampi TaxID=1449801 RepID=A0ABV6LM54_9BACI